MEELLLLMPKFMNYEHCVINALKKAYRVTWINCDEHDIEILKDYKNCSKVRWAMRHLFRTVREKDQEHSENKYLEDSLKQINLTNNNYSVVFSINGSFLSDAFYQRLKELNPKARYIYYAWDDTCNLIKQSHLRFFDEIYSYNIEECRRKKWRYIPVFAQNEVIGHDLENAYDILFVGSAHSDRQRIADELYRKYGKKYRLFIYLYDPAHTRGQFCHEQPLTYEKYIEYMRKSKAILDVPYSTQKGPTTRSFDALLTRTKVITMNLHMREYPIYSENILIIDRNNITIDDEFMEKPYVETGYEALTIQEWIKKFDL